MPTNTVTLTIQCHCEAEAPDQYGRIHRECLPFLVDHPSVVHYTIDCETLQGYIQYERFGVYVLVNGRTTHLSDDGEHTYCGRPKGAGWLEAVASCWFTRYTTGEMCMTCGRVQDRLMDQKAGV